MVLFHPLRISWYVSGVRIRLACLVVIFSAANCMPATGVTLFTDRSQFFQQNTRLAKEDFSEPGKSIAFPGPLDAFTDNTEVDPGHIIRGLTVDTIPAFVNNLFLGASPVGGRHANTIGNNNQFSTLQFEFAVLNATAVGMDVYGFGGTTNIHVDIFSPTGQIGSATMGMSSPSSPGFLGVQVERNTISRLEFSRNAFDSFVNVYEFHAGPSGIIGESGSIMTQVSRNSSPDTVLVRWTSENGVRYALDRATAKTGNSYVEFMNRVFATPPQNELMVDVKNIPFANFRVRAMADP